MDVNQTIKINQLVKEFKKHGIATDEEAIKKAKQLVERDVISEPTKTEQKTGEQTMDDQSIMNIINRKSILPSRTNRQKNERRNRQAKSRNEQHSKRNKNAKRNNKSNNGNETSSNTKPTTNNTTSSTTTNKQKRRRQ